MHIHDNYIKPLGPSFCLHIPVKSEQIHRTLSGFVQIQKKNHHNNILQLHNYIKPLGLSDITVQ